MRCFFALVVFVAGCSSGGGSADMNPGDLSMPLATTCHDKVKDGDETDVDCGGSCPGCANAESCKLDSDCTSLQCVMGVCVEATCTDGILNGGETDIDCGGPMCPTCPGGKKCMAITDCDSAVCVAGICAAVMPDMAAPLTYDFAMSEDLAVPVENDLAGPMNDLTAPRGDLPLSPDLSLGPGCFDGVQDGKETDIDCGGPNCLKCNSEQKCLVPADCSNGRCVKNLCGGGLTLAFGLADSYPTNTTPNAIAAGDFNGDKNIDIAISDDSAGLVTPGNASVLFGNGKGILGAVASYPVGIVPRRILARDFNGDGRVDLALLDSGVPGANSAVSVLLANANGTFPKSVDTVANPSPIDFTTADFNGDGKLDIAMTIDAPDGTPGQASVLLGKGTGAFAAPVSFAAGFHPVQIAAADFNGDKKIDLVVAASGDIGGDPSTLNLYLGKGDGTFAAAVTLAAAPALVVTTGDINVDGNADILYLDCCPMPTAGVLLGNGKGAFQAPVPFTTVGGGVIVIADFDLDGKLDLAFPLIASVAVTLGNGDGTFQPPQTFPAGNTLLGLVALDLNGDGKPDLASAAYGDNAVSVLLNTSM